MHIFKDLFIRNLEADTYLENFLVSAIVSVFVIRLFLFLTGFPQLGAGVYHIAHIVWGGFFMLIALVILIAFMSQKAASFAAVLGGIGFGAFIDELGKFITTDNDYFFEPTIAFIYITFVALFLITRFIPNYRKVSQREYLVNAIEMLKESAINDFDREEQKQAMKYLDQCDPKNPTVKALKQLMKRLEVTPTPRLGLYMRFRHEFRRRYYAIARSSLVVNLAIFFLVIKTLLAFSSSATVTVSRTELSFSEWGQLYASALAGIFVMIGLFALHISKAEAYRFFRISILITLLLSGFFGLMKLHWTDGLILGANILTLMVINYAMIRDRLANTQEV